MKTIVKITFLSVFILSSLDISSQSTVSFTTTQDTARVGEVITLKYHINAPLETVDSIDFNPLFDIENLVYPQDTTLLEKIMDISIIDGSSIGINNQNLIVEGDQLKSQSGIIKVAFYSFGVCDINNPSLYLKNGSEGLPIQKSRLFVIPPSSYQEMLDSLQLLDIKPIIEEKRNWTDYVVILYAMIGLLLLFGLYRYLAKRQTENKSTIIEEEIVIIPAHIKAIEALNKLDEQKLWQKGDIKGYQSSLTRIMRQYIEDRYEIQALEMTTSQLKSKLKNEELDDDLIGNMVDILQIADIVKFAKGTAGPELNQRFMVDAREWIDKTKQNLVIE